MVRFNIRFCQYLHCRLYFPVRFTRVYESNFWSPMSTTSISKMATICALRGVSPQCLGVASVSDNGLWRAARSLYGVEILFQRLLIFRWSTSLQSLPFLFSDVFRWLVREYPGLGPPRRSEWYSMLVGWTYGKWWRKCTSKRNRMTSVITNSQAKL